MAQVQSTFYADSWDDEVSSVLLTEDIEYSDVQDLHHFETSEKTAYLCGIKIPQSAFNNLRPERINRLEEYKRVRGIHELTPNQEYIFKAVTYGGMKDIFNTSSVGSGKTLGVIMISYLYGLLADGKRNSTIIVVPRVHKELIKQIKQMIDEIGNSTRSQIERDVDKSSVLIISSGATEGQELTRRELDFYEFIIVELEQIHRLPPYFDKVEDFMLVFDEAHTLFNQSYEFYHNFCLSKKSTDPDEIEYVRQIEEASSYDPFSMKLVNWYNGSPENRHKPKRDMFGDFSEFVGLCASSRKLKQVILLSGTGFIEQDTQKKPYEIASDLWKTHKMPLEFVNFQKANTEVIVHYFELYKEGIPSTKDGPQVYELVMNLTLNSLGSGRTLMVCRDSQLEFILETLRGFALSSGFTYTSDPMYWNDPTVNIIVIKQSEIDKVAGLTIPNLETVILTTGGRREYLSKIIQVSGRVDRMNQKDQQQRVIVFVQRFGKVSLVKEETETSADFIEYCREKKYRIVSHNTREPIVYNPFVRDYAVLRRKPCVSVPEEKQAEFHELLNKLNRPVACPRTVKGETCTARACHYLHRFYKVADLKGNQIVIPSSIRILELPPHEFCRDYCYNGYCDRSWCKKIHHEGYFVPKPRTESSTREGQRPETKPTKVWASVSKTEALPRTKKFEHRSSDTRQRQERQPPVEIRKPRAVVHKTISTSTDGFTQVGRVKEDKYSKEFPALPGFKPTLPKQVTVPRAPRKLPKNSFDILDDSEDEL